MRIVERMHKTNVICTDEPGAGGACHEYSIVKENNPFKNTISDSLKEGILTSIHFQNGPILENGRNGCTNEDLIIIVVDRLNGFQSGEFSCRENAIARTKLEEALMWLNKRTSDRLKRGVEGRSIV